MRILFVLITLCFVLHNPAGWQQSDSIQDNPARCVPYTDSVTKTNYFILVDTMPEYPGGMNELLQFFMSNFIYPQNAEIFGRITIEIIIDSNGKMKDIKIIHPDQIQVQNEVIRVLKMMPDWKPGKCNGHPVNVKIVIPIHISLQ